MPTPNPNASNDKVSAMPSVGETRFYALDALRGLAALTVVLYHWRHFFFRGLQAPAELDPDLLPFGSVLAHVHGDGDLAVDLFFVLSAFVFYWIYSEAIAERHVRGWSFFVYRFSRLYPLAFATLILVACLQAAFLRLTGSYFVYPANDQFTFLLHLFLASDWGLQVLAPHLGFIKGHGFNAPIWSVSVEVLLYVAFFVLCAGRFLTARWLALGMSAGLCLMLFISPTLGRGAWSFFAGGLAFYVFRRLRPCSFRVHALVVVVTLGLWVVAVTGSLSVHWSFLPADRDVILGRTPLYEYLFWTTLVFPGTVLSMALLEPRFGQATSHLKFLGDISYSTYLLHFPLQIVFVLVGLLVGVGADFYSRWTTFLLFFALLMAISLAAYHWYEYPMRRLLRRRLDVLDPQRLTKWRTARRPGA